MEHYKEWEWKNASISLVPNSLTFLSSSRPHIIILVKNLFLDDIWKNSIYATRITALCSFLFFPNYKSWGKQHHLVKYGYVLKDKFNPESHGVNL